MAFSKFHESDKYNNRNVSVLTEKRVEIHYKHQLEDDPVSPNPNIFVACFTTCWAHLHLYEALDLQQVRVLYFDPDAVKLAALTCIVLHNICIAANDTLPPQLDLTTDPFT